MAMLDRGNIFGITTHGSSYARPPAAPPSGSPSPRHAAGRGANATAPAAAAAPSALDVLTARALDGRSISRCDKALLPELVAALRAERDDRVTRGQFASSETADAAFVHADGLLRDWQCRETQRSLQGALGVRMDAAVADRGLAVPFYGGLGRNMSAAFDDECSALAVAHSRELEDLEAKWRGPVKLRAYNRASPHLIGLRMQREKLLRLREYEASRGAARAARVLATREAATTHTNLEYDYRAILRATLEHQAVERAQLGSVQYSKRTGFEAARDIEICILDRRIGKIECENEKARDIAHVERLVRRRELARTGVVKERPQAMSARTCGKKEVVVAEFNEMALPPLGQSARARLATQRASRAG